MSAERKRLVKTKEIAALLDTTPRMVNYYRRQGMPALRIGPRSYRYDHEEVMRWAERNALDGMNAEKKGGRK